MRKKSKYFHHMEDLSEIMLTEKSKSRMIATENILFPIVYGCPTARKPVSWDAFKHFKLPSFIASRPQALLKCRVDYDSMSKQREEDSARRKFRV